MVSRCFVCLWTPIFCDQMLERVPIKTINIFYIAYTGACDSLVFMLQYQGFLYPLLSSRESKILLELFWMVKHPGAAVQPELMDVVSRSCVPFTVCANDSEFYPPFHILYMMVPQANPG